MSTMSYPGLIKKHDLSFRRKKKKSSRPYKFTSSMIMTYMMNRNTNNKYERGRLTCASENDINID